MAPLGIVLGGIAIVIAACGEARPTADGRVLQSPPGGDAQVGRDLIPVYGCQTCHVIPGIRGGGHVGPPLTNFARRSFVAGVVENNPDNLMTWIIDPPSINPGTAMPAMGVTGEDALNIAAYLATLY
jgi:cytochrome c